MDVRSGSTPASSTWYSQYTITSVPISVQILTVANISNFTAFDGTSELWKVYRARFQTFAETHSIPDDKWAQVFLANQTTTAYKLISIMAKQLSTPKDINELTLNEITGFMEKQFDPKHFVVREIFKRDHPRNGSQN